MVRNPFGVLKHDWRRRAKRKTAAQLAKAGAGLWLEARYGWRPLLYDLSNFANAAGKFEEARKLSRLGGRQAGETFHTRWKDTSKEVPDSEYSDADWAALVNNDSWSSNTNGVVSLKWVDVTTEAVISCQMQRMFSEASALFRSLYGNVGLDSRSILTTLWEIVPYSFVVDWFVNSDRILACPDMKWLNSAPLERIGYSRKVVAHYKAHVIACPPWSRGSGWECSTIGSRELVGEPGFVSWYSRTPDWPPADEFGDVFAGSGLSTLKIADGIGLLTRFLR